jgi:hypothetical protein
VEASQALRAAWDGAAREAFDRAETGFRASMTDRAALVAEAGSALKSLALAYTAADLRGQQALGPEQ